jgi:hypothetical protein
LPQLQLRVAELPSCGVAAAAVAGLPLLQLPVCHFGRLACRSTRSVFVALKIMQQVETENETKIFSYVVLMF